MSGQQPVARDGATETSDAEGTPAQEGFSMPPEWAPHAGCLMQWPTRRELWRDRFDDAKRDHAIIARAIADFEPLTVICGADDAGEVRGACGGGIQILESPIDDSWVRDNGPIFVRDGAGRLAVVDFGFNAWGERWHPHDGDDAVPRRVAEHLGMRIFSAPFVLEGGSFFVDGEGTLITTEQCLLDPNRNPTMDRERIERGLRAFLGVTTIVWLKTGHILDVGPEGTDGHVDGVLQYVAPGHVMLEMPSGSNGAAHESARVNRDRLASMLDARGRSFTVSELDPGDPPTVSYANFYIANGAVIVPTGGGEADERALSFIAELYPGREVVGVPGAALAFGGGGPHCITQQIPTGDPAPI
ncbi:MAG: agmatine deiminase family protein [Actinomycetota bacterium]